MGSKLFGATLSVVVLCFQLAGAPKRPVDLSEITASSDVVVLARVVSVEKLTPSSPEALDGTTAFQMLITADHVIKGDLQESALKIKFIAPRDYGAVSSGQYRFFVLNRSGPLFEFADANYPYLPASSDITVLPGPPLDQVTLVLGLSLGNAGSLSDGEREQDLDALRRLHTALAGTVLREAMQKTQESLQLEIARAFSASLRNPGTKSEQ